MEKAIVIIYLRYMSSVPTRPSPVVLLMPHLHCLLPAARVGVLALSNVTSAGLNFSRDDITERDWRNSLCHHEKHAIQQQQPEMSVRTIWLQIFVLCGYKHFIVLEEVQPWITSSIDINTLDNTGSIYKKCYLLDLLIIDQVVDRSSGVHLMKFNRNSVSEVAWPRSELGFPEMVFDEEHKKE
jgi:hypothetical protein